MQPPPQWPGSWMPGLKIVRQDRLPAGPGVDPLEAGSPGSPWWGIQAPDGSLYGWWVAESGAKAFLEKCLREYAHSLVAAADGKELRYIIRLLE